MKIQELENGIPFVGYGIEIGAVNGVCHKKFSSKKYIISSIKPFSNIVIIKCVSNYHSKSMYENYKKDKKRFILLAGEIEKDRIFKQNSQINSINTKSSDMGKKLSFNNGIFKSDDNYINN